MLTQRHVCLAAIAATLALSSIAAPADARGGGHGGWRGGTATFHSAPPATSAGGVSQGSGGKQGSSSGALSDTSSVPTGPILSAPPPASAIAAPAPQLPAVAPLSPPVTTTILSGGGSPRTDTLASPTPTSTSPSEAAPSLAGGGGDTLRDCMGFWDAATHMSKGEWRAACTRTLHRLDLIGPVPGTPGKPVADHQRPSHTHASR